MRRCRSSVKAGAIAAALAATPWVWAQRRGQGFFEQIVGDGFGLRWRCHAER
jgi:hypothetical protein